MAEAVVCKKCGATISKATAFNNRGRCAECNRSPEVRLRNDVIGSAVGAVLLAALSIAVFLLFSAMEVTEERIRMPIILIPIYKEFGPVGMALVPLLGAGGLTWMCVVKRRRLRELEAGEDPGA